MTCIQTDGPCKNILKNIPDEQKDEYTTGEDYNMDLSNVTNIMIEGISRSGPVRQHIERLGRETFAKECALHLASKGLSEEGSTTLEIAEGVDDFCRDRVEGYPKKEAGQ